MNYFGSFIVILTVIAIVYYFENKNNATLTEKQKEVIKTVLLQLVIQAEAKFGSKTGKVKFSYVYGELLKHFEWLKYVPLEVVNELIEDSLSTMRHLLETNKNVREIVETKE